jgi:quercetin dioxygenase-like cupin family protein
MTGSGTSWSSIRVQNLVHKHTILVVVLAASGALAQRVVPITGEPHHHLVISNDYARVFQVEVPPKAATLYHQHNYDYVYVAIGDADVTSKRLHENPITVRLKDGEVELAKGAFAHQARNNGDQAFRNVTIELLGGIGTPICGLVGPEKSCGVGSGAAGGTGDASDADRRRFTMKSMPLLRSSSVTVSRVTFEGHAEADLSLWSSGPSLLIPISNANLRSISQNSTQVIVGHAGMPVWIPEHRTRLANLSQSAKFILISFSPRAAAVK